MSNGIFKLNWTDVAKGLVVAVIASVFVYILAALNAPGFSFVTINYAEIARIALASGIGYLLKNFISSDQGNVLALGDK